MPRSIKPLSSRATLALDIIRGRKLYERLEALDDEEAMNVVSYVMDLFSKAADGTACEARAIPLLVVKMLAAALEVSTSIGAAQYRATVADIANARQEGAALGARLAAIIEKGV